MFLLCTHGTAEGFTNPPDTCMLYDYWTSFLSTTLHSWSSSGSWRPLWWSHCWHCDRLCRGHFPHYTSGCAGAMHCLLLSEENKTNSCWGSSWSGVRYTETVFVLKLIITDNSSLISKFSLHEVGIVLTDINSLLWYFPWTTQGQMYNRLSWYLYFHKPLKAIVDQVHKWSINNRLEWDFP